MVNAAADGGGSKKVTVSAPSSGGTGGGGFQFDPEQLDAIIAKWENLKTDLENDQYDAEAMANVKAPGKEFASGDWEKSANPSGKAFLQQNKKMRDYVDDYIQALNDAKKTITNNNADAAAAINRAGSQAV